MSKKIMEKYQQQLADYTDEEVKEFNKRIEILLDPSEFEITAEDKEAIGYFYLKLHVMEEEFWDEKKQIPDFYAVAQKVLDIFHMSKEGNEGMTFPEWLDFKRGIKPHYPYSPFGIGLTEKLQQNKRRIKDFIKINHQ